jgi:hypothetical protein
MPKARPKTGEKRKTHQPLHMDRLPPEVLDEILRLRNGRGKTWEEISALTAEPVGDKKCGFIDWKALDPEVRKLFPKFRIAVTTLHRWFDIRVAQVRADVQVRSNQARLIAESFAKSNLVNGDEAVINAARDTLMGVLSEDSSEDGRLNATKGLIKLGELMQKAKTNSIRERGVAIDEQNLQLKLDEIKRRAEKLIQAAEKGKPGSPLQMSREQLMEHVKGIYGIA